MSTLIALNNKGRRKFSARAHGSNRWAMIMPTWNVPSFYYNEFPMRWRDSRQKLNFDMSLELNYFELAQKFQVYAPFIDFLKILWSWKKWQKLTKNNPKIGKFVLNDIFWAIFTKLDIIHLNMLSPSQVRNFFHFMEKVFFKSWVFSLLTVWILILEIYTIYS